MIYIITAIYPEAKPWILKYGLKKDNSITHFQLFSGDRMRLIITGVGKLNAAIAVTELFSCFKPGKRDVMINFGIAASKEAFGSLYVCSSICDDDTERVYYPDMIIDTGLPERPLRTYSKPVTDMSSLGLADMEASGVYTAAQHFLELHQMIFVKMVSDRGDGTLPDAGELEKMISDAVMKLDSCVRDIAAADMNEQHGDTMDDESITASIAESQLFQELSELLHLSVTMRSSLLQQLTYASLKGMDVNVFLGVKLEYVRDILRSGIQGEQKLRKLKKEERAVIFEEIRREIIVSPYIR